MDKIEKNVDHAKNKIAGGAKQAAGKITGNEQLELKGKVQSLKAELKNNIDKTSRAVKKQK